MAAFAGLRRAELLNLGWEDLARPQLARFLRKPPRTLKNWDTRGCVPTGVRWHPPQKVSGKVALYEVSRNWPAIQSVLPEERDRSADRQLAQELMDAGRE